MGNKRKSCLECPKQADLCLECRRDALGMWKLVKGRDPVQYVYGYWTKYKRGR